MADKEIAMLPGSSGVTDDTIIPVYQPGALEPAQSMTGAQFRKWAEDSVQPQVEAAEAAAKEAEETAKSIKLEPVYEELALKGDNLEFDPDTGLLYLTAYGNRVSTGIKIETSDRGNAAALNYIYEILRRGVFTEDVSFLMAALKQAIESGDSGGTEPDDGPVVGTRYYIKQNLTNVTSSNATISVSEGAAYTTTLTAVDGYNLSAVSVTMGGVDVTASAYSNGVISIVSVTGNIVITAVAKGVVEEYLNPVVFSNPTNPYASYPDITTFEYNVIEPNENVASYQSSCLFEAPETTGGTLVIDFDDTRISGAFRALVWLLNADGTAYKMIHPRNPPDYTGSGTPLLSGGWSGNMTYTLDDPGSSPAWTLIKGQTRVEIPDGKKPIVVCLTNSGYTTILDESLIDSGNAARMYHVMKAVHTDGLITAKVVKEV